jgi:hypothetical protein
MTAFYPAVGTGRKRHARERYGSFPEVRSLPNVGADSRSIPESFWRLGSSRCTILLFCSC